MHDCITIIEPPLSLSRDFVDYPYHADLGPVQMAGVLRDAGCEVSLIHAMAMPESDVRPDAMTPDRVVIGAPLEVVLGHVAEPSVLVVHLTPFHRPPARDRLLGLLMTRLREAWPETPLVLADMYQSGQHYIEAPAGQILAAYPEIDVLIKYEAEGVIARICAELGETGRPATPRAEAGPSVPDLNRLAFPAWDRVDLKARDAFMSRLVTTLGRGDWAFPIDGRTLPLITSRGCPYRCAHCSSNPGRPTLDTPKTQRRYSREYLAEGIDRLVRLHEATRIAVLDEMVNVKPGHFDGLLSELCAHEALLFDFPNGMRADWVTSDQLEAMSGRVKTLSISAESGVQRVVDEVVGKSIALDAIENTVRGATQRGIPTLVHFIIGMPGESRADINGTLEYALELWETYGAWPSVQFATPLPGTRLEQRAREASRVALPKIRDFNPLFQHVPVTQSDAFTPEDLRRFKWTFDQRLAAGRGPTKVIMNVTYRCNNHCTFCATGNRTQLDGDFDNQRRILARFAEQGLWQVDFDGGEPTLYERLIPLVRYAREIGYRRVNVTTNGRRCAYPAYARKLVNSGLTTLLFSVHGHDARTHAQNVGVAEAWEQTLEGIRNAVAAAPAGVELGMNITITKSNHEALPEIAQLCWDLGLRWLNLQFLTPFGRATVHVNPDTQRAANIAMRVIDAWRDRIRFQVINLPFCFMPGYEAFMMGDLLKIQRHMVFINNIDVNLFAYLKEQRGYQSECAGCPHKSFCGGFYELKDTRQAPWEVTMEDTRASLADMNARGPA